MKHISILSLLVLLVISTSTNCKKNNPESQLPPATEEGKNTCGFLVNGKVWVPVRSGFDELAFYYDPNYMNGEISLSGKKYEPSSNTNFTSFVIAVSNISSSGLYKLNVGPNAIGKFGRSMPLCFYSWEDTIPNHNAYLNITKFDIQKRIISGTFEFSQIKTGCEEVRITQGRFDMKF